MNGNREGLSETSLKNAVRTACRQDWDDLLQNMKDYEHVFSAEFEKKMESLISRTPEETAKEDGIQQDDAQPIRVSGRPHKKRIWRYLLIAALLAGLGIGAVLTNGSVLEKIGNMFLHIYEHNVEWHGSDADTERKEIFVRYYPKYLPQGYQLTELYTSAGVDAAYENIYGKRILYSQADARASHISVSMENDDIEKTVINDTEAEIVSDGVYSSILFENDGYIFMISVPESERMELRKIAESIPIWK